MNVDSITSVKEEKFRKHLEALFVAIVFALFLITFFNLIGALITYVALISGVSFFGWITGIAVTAYLSISGLLGDTFHFCIKCAKRFANGMADGYYDTPVVV
jgi:hypothetical protein